MSTSGSLLRARRQKRNDDARRPTRGERDVRSGEGYVATAPELRSPVTALSLGGLRRRIEALIRRSSMTTARSMMANVAAGDHDNDKVAHCGRIRCSTSSATDVRDQVREPPPGGPRPRGRHEVVNG
jgi:hypothetical protein